jgi:hypothetical protein
MWRPEPLLERRASRAKREQWPQRFHARVVGSKRSGSIRRARALVRVDETSAAPAESREPSLRDSRHWRVAWRRRGHREAVEPWRRRERIDRGTGRAMLLRVHEDVDDRVPNGARRLQLARVEAVGPDAAAHPQEIVDAACEPNGEALHATCEGARVASFDDEVEVIALDGELDDMEDVAELARAIGRADAVAYGAKERGLAERRKTSACPHRHVHRVRSAVTLAPAVRNRAAPGPPLATRSISLAAPGRQFDVELLQLELSIYYGGA